MTALAELNGHARPGDYAQAYRAAGLSPIAIRADGTKAPEGAWKRFQTEPASESELATKFLASNVGIGICYGAGSGNAELIDVDDEASYQPFADEVERSAPGLLAKLCIIKTPRPGRHVVYRCDQVEGNQKLAMRYATPEELQAKPEEKVKTKIETRGQGGYALAPGGDPAAHSTGRPYEHAAGPALTELSAISVEEREILLRSARLLNEVVEDEPAEAKGQSIAHSAGGPKVQQTGHLPGTSPGDDFNLRVSWDEILAPHGWTKSHAVGDVQHWTRPGKDQGTSATTGLQSKHGNDLLCVFSTSAHPFPGANGTPCSTHSKFGAYCLLNHNGDFAAAARQLGADGYGDAPQRQGMPNLLPDDVRDLGDIPAPTPRPAKRPPEPVPSPAPYPVGSLPAVLSEFVERSAAAIDVCPSTIGLASVVTCAAAIGNSREVQVNPNWKEPCALFGGIIARSGARKTPALSMAADPLSQLDFDAIDAYEEAVEKFNEDQARYQAAAKDWKKNPDGPAPEPPKPPVEARHVASNCTTEKLAHLLGDNHRGLLCFHDELAALFGNMDRYSGGGSVSGDTPFYLSAYNAKPYRHDRKVAGSVFLRRPLLSIVGACQPSIFTTAMSGANEENGLLARFLLTFPDDRSHKWSDGDRVNSFDYTNLITDLTELHPAGFDGKKILPEPVELDRDAKELFKAWYCEIQEERQIASDVEAAALAKLEGAAARMALVFHCVRAASDEAVHAFTIDATTMRSTLTVMRWHRGETLRAYKALQADGEIRERKRLADYLVERFGGVVTARDLKRNGPAKYRDGDAAELALNGLSSSGLGTWRTTPAGERGGRPKRELVLRETR